MMAAKHKDLGEISRDTGNSCNASIGLLEELEFLANSSMSGTRYLGLLGTAVCSKASLLQMRERQIEDSLSVAPLCLV